MGLPFFIAATLRANWNYTSRRSVEGRGVNEKRVIVDLETRKVIKIIEK